MRSAEELAKLMAAYSASPSDQEAQTQFRIDLVDAWKIEPGMRILEIGCGQGDMTAVLADVVGPDGCIVAIDSAHSSYGAPVSVGASADHLKQGELGERISFRFDCDVLDPAVEFDPGEFDAVVLALCTWYFDSTEQLKMVLDRVRRWASSLHMAEWDMQPENRAQMAHLMAVLIQAQIQARSLVGDGNVRSPYSRQQRDRLLAATGWTPIRENVMQTAGLSDARWEIANCLESAMDDSIAAGFTEKERVLLASQLDILRQLEVGECLPVLSVSANRCHD